MIEHFNSFWRNSLILAPRVCAKNTQRKAPYSRFSQAIALMPSLNGYVATDDTASTENTAAETFITNGLSKVLKINNVFNDMLYGGGYTYAAGGAIYSDPNAKLNTKTAAFETQNGESIVLFYNPNCRADMQESSTYSQSKVCANFIYNLNGNKGPNSVGKDIGIMTVLYPSDPAVVAPVPAIRDITGIKQFETGKKCA